MSYGLIMKGSPPSSGRRTPGKQPVMAKKVSSRAAASSTAISVKAPAKAAQKAKAGAGKGKGAVKAVAPSGQVKASKGIKPGSGRPLKSATPKAPLAKGHGAKKPTPTPVAAKPPKMPAKAGAAKATKADIRAVTVKRAAVDVKSGVKMKGNSAPDKTVKAVKSGADRQTSSPNVVIVKPQPAPAKVVLPENYKPIDAEPYMNPMQRQYFRIKLRNWKEDILRQTRETLQGMHEDTIQYADLADRATSETDRALELRARDRQRKLISKIDAALARIEDGTYGYCEETGEPIGLKRLDARPIATLSLEAQERHERRERVHRGD